MVGPTFYRELRSQACTVPFIMVSAVGARRVAAHLGANAAIDKPFDLDNVVEVVEALGRPD